MVDGAPPAVVLLDLEEGVAGGVLPDVGERTELCRSVTALAELAAARSWP